MRKDCPSTGECLRKLREQEMKQKGGRRGRGEGRRGEKFVPSRGRRHEPGFLHAPTRSLATYRPRAPQTRPDPVRQHHLPDPPKSTQPVLFHTGQGTSCLIFLRLTPTWKVILYPPAQVMEKEGHCIQVRSLPSLPAGQGVGWTGSPVFIFLPDSLGL